MKEIRDKIIGRTILVGIFVTNTPLVLVKDILLTSSWSIKRSVAWLKENWNDVHEDD